MSDCRFGVSPVNYPDPGPERQEIQTVYLKKYLAYIFFDMYGLYYTKPCLRSLRGYSD